MYSRLLFPLFLLTALSLFSDESKPLNPVVHTTMSVSPLVHGCVNTITGDYVETVQDLAVAGPEPLILERTHCSSDGRIYSLYQGWRHSFDGYIKNELINQYTSYIMAEYTPTSGTGGIFRGNYRKQHPDVISTFRPDYNPKGFTNCCSGILSARTNPKNTVLAYDKHAKTFRATSAAGTQFTFKRRHKSDTVYPVRTEKRKNGHTLFYNYDHDECNLTSVSMKDATAQVNFNTIDFLHYQKNSKKEGKRLFEIKGSDGRSVQYELQPTRSHATEERHAQVTHHHYYISKVSSAHAPSIEYVYDKKEGKNSRYLIERKMPNDRLLKIKYCNIHDHVVALSAPVGVDKTPIQIYRFSYYPKRTCIADDYGTCIERGQDGTTEVLDADDNKTEYKYDVERRLRKIKHFSKNNLVSRESFEWGPNDIKSQAGNLLSKRLEDPACNIVLAHTFMYDVHGNVITDCFFGNISGNSQPIIWDEKTHHPVHNGCDGYRHYYSYNAEHLMTSESEENGRGAIYTYIEGTDLLASKCITMHGAIVCRHFYEYDSNAVLIKCIVDDGTTGDKNNLKGVTQRHITKIEPKKSAPVGAPEVVNNYYLDLAANKERLLKSLHRSFNAQGQILKEAHSDSKNNVRYTLEWQYDAHGNVISETNALGQTLTRQFDENNNVIYETGFVPGHYKEHTYDYSNRLIKTVEVLSDGTKMSNEHSYDRMSNRVATIDAFNQRTQFTYDAFGRVIKVTYPEVINEQGKLVQTAIEKGYDIQGYEISYKDQNGFEIKTRYNVHGKPLSHLYPDGSSESFKYNLDGTLKESIAKTGLITRFTYDCLGRLLTKGIYSANGTLISETSSTYNTFHVTSTTDAQGNVTLFKYDGAGRLIETLQNKKRTTLAYNELGQCFKTCEWYGESSKAYRMMLKEFDFLNRVIEERVEDGQNPGEALRLTQTTYDANGNVAEFTQFSEAGSSTTYTTYNEHKQPLKIINAVGETRFEYNHKAVNAWGQTVLETTQTDPNGIKTITTHNTLGKVAYTQKKNSLNTLLCKKEFFYSNTGDCVSAVDTIINPDASSRKVTTHWNFNAMHQLLDLVEAVGTPEQKHTQQRYNSRGEKTHTIKPDGTALLYTYDAKGRLASFTSSDKSFTYTYAYDVGDNLIDVYDTEQKTHTVRTYDPYNNLIAEELGNGQLVKYSYDLLGRPVHNILSDGSSVKYIYNASYLLSVIRQDKQNKQQYHLDYSQYDQSGNVTAIQLPGKAGKISYKYDLLGRIEQVISPDRQEDMTYDAVGNLLTRGINETGRRTKETFAYNDLYQLISEKGRIAHSYQCDSMYNCLNKDGNKRKFNALNQLLTHDDIAFKYDDNGNLIEKAVKSDKTTYQYDALDRLISVNTPQQQIRYTYDSFNRRLTRQFKPKSGSGVTETFLYLGQNEVGTCNDKGEIKQLRILGVGRGAEIGATVAIELSGKNVMSPIHDQNGNIVKLVDTITGKCVESYQFSGFGEEKIYAANGSECVTSAVGNPWRFSSKRKDEETGFVYFGRRYYDPEMCRWVTPDPIGFDGGPNLYAYVLNNPLTHIDLYGLWAKARQARIRENRANGGWDPLDTVRDSFKAVGRCTRDFARDFIPVPVVGDAIRGVGNLLSGDRRTLDGVFYDPSAYTTKVGNHATASNHSVMCLNGMCYEPRDAELMASLISQEIGDRHVNLVYNPSIGLLGDMCEGGAQLAGIETKIVEYFKEQIMQQYNVVGPEGSIDLRDHSQGGLITYRVLQKLPPEVRSIMHVTTYGTAKCIFRKEFDLASATNNISNWDPIPLIGDPYNYLKARICGHEDVVFLPSKKEWSLIPFDHSFSGPTYQGVWKEEAKVIRNNFNY
ncbi:MAG: hypothetical protein H0X51_02445 [Parachlamydiaceae bacterium]|nr:hypothetical protein [Parachlamydiaceae bacterium]